MSIQDLRKHKLFGLAIFDLVISLIFIIALFMISWKIHFKKLQWFKFVLAGILLTIPVGIVSHVLFGVDTQLNYNLGLSNKPSK